MARLALTIAGAVAGAAIAYFSMGVATAAGVQLGMSIGALAGSIVGTVAFPGKGQHVYGPRVNDMQVSSSAPGQVIPLLFGVMRLGGQIIWSTGLLEHTTNTNQSAKGGPSVTQTTYTYSCSFAAGFCQGPGKITRIWGDTKLIYNATGNTNPHRGVWNSTTEYFTNDVVTENVTGNTFICLVTTIGNPPENSNYWAPDIADQSVTVSKYTPPVLHPGDETQLPSSLIQAHEGVSVTPAYRGLVYGVWENMPLADFGNRLPNIRAEVTSNGANAYPMPLIQWPQDSFRPAAVVTSPDFQTAYAFNNANVDNDHAYIQRIDLNTNTIVASGIIDMTTLAGFIPGVDRVAGYNGIMTVDSQGNLWGYGEVNHNPGIVKLDQWTFKALSFFDLDANGVMSHAVPYAITTYVAQDGTSFIIGFSPLSSVGAGNGSVMFAITVNGIPFGQGANGLPTYSVLPGGLWGQYYNINAPQKSGDNSDPTAHFDQIYPVTDGNGNVYFIFRITRNPSGATGEWAIAQINLFAGQNVFLNPAPVFEGFKCWVYPADSNIGVGSALFWNPSDATITVLTDTGVYLKIDPTTFNGAILNQVGDTSHPQFGLSGGHIAGGFLSFSVDDHGCAVQAAFKGQAQNGLIFVPALSGNHVLSVETGGFTTVATYDFGNYPNKPPTGGSTWPSTGAQYTGHGYMYDPIANALLAVSLSTAPVGFATAYATYRAYLDRLSSSGVTAASIVEDICELATIPSENVDASALAGILVSGYPITNLQTGRDMLNVLGGAYFFEGRESDFKLQFVPRGQAIAANIPEVDLGMLNDGAALTESIGQEQDVPKTVEVLYIDPLMDFQQGQQKKIRHSVTKKSFNQTSISMPLVMSALQAAQLADKLLWSAESERRTYKTNMWKSLYMLLDPSDVVTFSYHGSLLTARVADNTIGQNFAIAMDLVYEDGNTYFSVATGDTSTGFVGQTIPPLGLSMLWMLDIPYLQDQDADAAGNLGFYFAMVPTSAGAAWPAGVLYSSSDNKAFAQLGATTIKTTYGITQTILGEPASVFALDKVNTLKVRMVQGAAPNSDTLLNVLNGTNAAIMYPSLEVIQFTTVTDNGDDTITLSGLLRGRRGTDDFTGGHAIGETVIFPLAGGLVHEQLSLSLLNLVRFYRAITVGADLNSNPISQSLALKGRDLMPYAPAAFYNKPSSSDILFTWFRRTRLGGGWNDGTGQVPLSEVNESYDIDILDGTGVVKRTFAGIIPPGSVPDSWTSPAQPHQLYTAAQQATDGYLAGHGWTAVCYQLSGQVGRGFPTTVALP